MNENKDRVRELFLEGCKDDALRLAYEWVKTRRWTLREFKEFMALWVELNTPKPEVA
jgi:hypothetical protein